MDKKGKVISLSGGKGGVGKTTSAANIAEALEHAGKSVVVIESDPQANLKHWKTNWFKKLGKNNTQKETFNTQLPASNLYKVINKVIEAFLIKENKIAEDVFANEEKIKEIETTFVNTVNTIVSESLISHNNIYYLFSDRLLQSFEKNFNEHNKKELISFIINSLRINFDFIIIDTPPALGDLTITMLSASDVLFMVTLANEFAVKGIQDTYGEFKKLKKTHPIKLGGIILTAYDKRKKVQTEIKSSLESISTQLNSPLFVVSTSVRFEEMPNIGIGVIQRIPDSKESMVYHNITNNILSILT